MDAKKRGGGVERVFLDEAVSISKEKGQTSLHWMKLLPGWPNSIPSKRNWWSYVSSAGLKR